MKFKEVLLCLWKLGKDNIKPRDPTFSIEHAKVQEDHFWSHFKGAIGAIDGSHIRVSVPAEEDVNHTCRYGYTSQNVLAICDFYMSFTFLVSGWPGSAHDTRVLNHALTNFSDEFPIAPTGKYYLVDSGYPNRTRYLAPFKESTYHILEFYFRRHCPPQGKYEKFNYLHSSLHNVIEHSFGILKQKWCTLKSMSSFLPRRQKHIIIACMTLHNFIRDISLRDGDFDKCDEDEDYMPQDKDDNEVKKVAQPTEYDIPDEKNEVFMNTIRDNIANVLVSGE
jgi:hypothetical protein